MGEEIKVICKNCGKFTAKSKAFCYNCGEKLVYRNESQLNYGNKQSSESEETNNKVQPSKQRL
jgi:predicted amidophosphoribosyltransferase